MKLRIFHTQQRSLNLIMKQSKFPENNHKILMAGIYFDIDIGLNELFGISGANILPFIELLWNISLDYAKNVSTRTHRLPFGINIFPTLLEKVEGLWNGTLPF